MHVCVCVWHGHGEEKKSYKSHRRHNGPVVINQRAVWRDRASATDKSSNCNEPSHFHRLYTFKHTHTYPGAPDRQSLMCRTTALVYWFLRSSRTNKIHSTTTVGSFAHTHTPEADAVFSLTYCRLTHRRQSVRPQWSGFKRFIFHSLTVKHLTKKKKKNPVSTVKMINKRTHYSCYNVKIGLVTTHSRYRRRG